MKIKNLLLIISILALSNNVLANKLDKPIKCPSVEAISQISFDTVEPCKDSWTVKIINNKFDTDDNWEFIAFPIIAENKTQALEKAHEAMKSMENYDPEPTEIGDDKWLCGYASYATNTIGGAYTIQK
jgi:hypothetical protein